jgi:hypothetical protein
LQCKYLAWPDTYTYRLFGLLKSGADWLVLLASSAEEANYTHPAHTRQHFVSKKL